MSQKLMLEKIEKAQREIDAKREVVKHGKMRQCYHFMGETGWINDPNGLIYFRGKYHYFYQHNPFTGFWDSMYWGHAVSDDLIHWEYLPLALAPSESYDNHLKGGCFSGSAIEHDGKLYLVYTGTCNNGNGFEQAQCIAYSEDGIHFEKYKGNPVISAPKGVPTDMFRDPKVWKHEDTFYLVCGASMNGFAQARLYKSKDMLNWEFVNVLAESRGEWGFMWECPDFFQVGNKYVLMFSPMGGKERTSVYLVGDFDYNTGKFFYKTSGEIDWGFDYYAPQSFEAADGRRVLVGWANAWDWMPFWKDWGPTYREGWCGFFNVPREAVLNKNGTLSFIPVKELEVLRKNKLERKEILLEDGREEEICDGSIYELKLRVNLKNTTAKKIILKLRVSDQKRTEIVFDLKKAEICFDRNHADDWSKGIARGPLNLMNKDCLDIHIYSDKISVELFSNEYQNNFSCNIYNVEEGQKNYIVAEGGVAEIDTLEKWDLENVMQ